MTPSRPLREHQYNFRVRERGPRTDCNLPTVRKERSRAFVEKSPRQRLNEISLITPYPSSTYTTYLVYLVGMSSLDLKLVTTSKTRSTVVTQPILGH